MLITRFSDKLISGKIEFNNGFYIVTGQVVRPQDKIRLFYKSPEPRDLRQSVVGSALPFPNPEIAFGSVNSGEAKLDASGNFKFKVFLPNTYYLNDFIPNGIGQGKLLSLPHINFHMVNPDNTFHDFNVILKDDFVPLRSLTNYPGKPIRSTGRNTPSMFVQ